MVKVLVVDSASDADSFSTFLQEDYTDLTGQELAVDTKASLEEQTKALSDSLYDVLIFKNGDNVSVVLSEVIQSQRLDIIVLFDSSGTLQSLKDLVPELEGDLVSWLSYSVMGRKLHNISYLYGMWVAEIAGKIADLTEGL